MPAKSGVAGGILAVLPGQLGIGVFSPRLDAHGNSVRGVAVCKDLSEDFGLHFLRVARSARSTVRRQYSLAAARSKRRRPEAERDILDRHGERAWIIELQGDLVFSTVEAAARRVVDHSAQSDFMLIDLQRVTHIDAAAARVLQDLYLSAGGSGMELHFVSAQRQPGFLRHLEEELARRAEPSRTLNFADLDAAIEWCENRLLGCYGSTAAQPPAAAASLSRQEICRGLDLPALRMLEGMVERRQFAAGEFIVRAGDQADAMFFLISGQVSVVITLSNGELRRLATLTPGMAFGELAIVMRSARSADIRADTTVECYVLPADAFDRLSTIQPGIKITLLDEHASPGARHGGAAEPGSRRARAVTACGCWVRRARCLQSALACANARSGPPKERD